MIDAVVFDAYGTLFDVHSVFDACDDAFPGHGEQICRIWRQKQLEYTWLRTLMRRYVNFEDVNRDALKYTLKYLNLRYEDITLESLIATYLSLQPFPEVLQALQAFQSRKLAILSNGTPHMLENVVRYAGLNTYFENIISVDPLQTYKPDPEVYQLAVSTLGVPRERILFVSSNGWDVAGSKAFGFIVGWINRMGKTVEELGVQPDYIVHDLFELANVISK